MIARKIADAFGNALTFGSATLATITQEDLRLWLVALVGLGISISCNIPRLKQRKREAQAALYASQEARQHLCAECLRDGTHSANCAVERHFRPQNCPLKDKSYEARQHF